MAFGKLEFILFVGEEALPVTDAEIIIIENEESQVINNEILKVNSDGKSKEIKLYTYEKALSEKPGTGIKPYKTYDALILSNTMKNKYIRGIPVFADVTSIQKVQMTPKVGRGADIDVVEIPPNGLIAEPEKPVEGELNPVNNKKPKILEKVVIPQYITVHLGSPSSNAQNVTVTFTDYIKNVASSEVYPTWPREAIKSNVYAQISFTLNRIYTEWYRSRGYDFDITNSTAYDHYFVSGRNIFDTISSVVDEVFDEYISKKGFEEPLIAQYCNGTTVTCAGLSQWGTVTYAEQGLKAFQILQKYYGNDIELRNAKYEYGTVESYPGKALRLGDKGEDVRTIQSHLNRIRKNYPGIPIIPNENGIFDEATKNAVISFQRVFNLTPDGIVGKQTWYKISQLYVGIKKLAELNSEGEKIDVPTTPPKEILRLGDKGESVKVLQYLLICIGAFYDSILPVKLTGVFDKATEDSVKSFQQEFNLGVDGIVGPLTWKKLLDIYKGIEPYILTSSGKFIKYPGYIIREGSRGEDVKLIQIWLNGLNKKYSFIPAVDADGIFGPKTRDAIMKFQRWANLASDGLVGPLTWDRLFAEFRKVV